MSSMVLDGARPRSRSTDPVTSVDAGRGADMRASQREVLDVFEFAQSMHGRADLADHELVQVAASMHSKFSAQRLRSARAELAEDGLIVLVEGEYRATASGKRARVWRVA